MDLTQLANLGEFIGGVAVLVTLVYLAVQLRQNTLLVAAQLRQEISRVSTDVAISTSLEELDVLVKASADPQSVSPAELRHACLLFMGVGNFYETLFYSRELGEVDPELWESRTNRLANFIGPAQHSLWPMMKDSFGQSFQDFVDHDLLPSLASDRPSWIR